ncbi:class F sortase [Aestuariimicrobium sp. T2.26MG-19.2B]|uniref:class F sortase n=1 Tax=Aestuariimicrobium sp. T2.26MG-19.2B TaxID=3040679 RepID=UPI0024778EFE|nr:class F sortase [Aestuariimicrobium sp. T2.26MG-19.2B]CAI9403390.1 hypothetical protein AESSP_00994 [Aestuariimicrobium sp. T2.26MG-19.2B]
MTPPRRRLLVGTPARWAAAVAVMALAGVTAVAVALTGQEPGPPAPVAAEGPVVTASAPPTSMGPTSSGPSSGATTLRSGSTTGSSAPTVGPSSSPQTARLTESIPQRLTIGSIGVSSSLVSLGLDGGAMQTPDNPDLAGWFTGAHTPGGPGTAVVAGHVTWNRRPTVFYRLGEVKVGTQVSVSRADGTTATFTVRRIGTFPKNSFPAQEVYSADPTPRLILITCGGQYDRSQHTYDSNVIVWADLTSST